jgi:hypothetical protein
VRARLLWAASLAAVYGAEERSLRGAG